MIKRDFQKVDTHRAQLSRSDHDLSASLGFTSSTGMILPVWQHFLNAGDAIYYSGNLLSRTQPMVSPAMVDVDVYLEWFFVPMTHLLNAWQNIRWMTNDFINSAYDPLKFDGVLPLVDINQQSAAPARSGSVPNYSNQFYDCYGKGTFRLLNHLGFNPYGVFDGDATYDSNNLPSRVNPSVFPYFALAYQSVFQDYYRVDDWDTRDVGSFNMDDVAIAGTQGTPLTGSIRGFFHLKYRPYHLDYFRSVQASPMMSSVNQVGLASTTSVTQGPTPMVVLSRINNYLSNRSYPSTDSPIGARNDQVQDLSGVFWNGGSGNTGNEFTTARYNKSQFSSAASENVQFGNITAAGIRNLFAVEKLLRISGKAKKNYDAQMLAHFGVEIPHDVKHEISHLHTDKAVIHIGEVVSTADTFESGVGGSALGSLSGKGYCSIRGEKKKFRAPVDGVVMCLYSAVPRLNYNGGFDKLNAVTSRLDFFIPEYDRLGKQPIYDYEGDYSLLGTSSMIGWQWRYEQYKRKYDRVTEAFKIPRNNTYVNNYASWINANLPYHYTPGTPGNFETLTFNNFYCTPHELDSIMVTPYQSIWNTAYSTTPWLMFATDPFISQFRANVKLVSVMSKTGEPLLD